jgi:hypothetical protein
MPHIKYSIASVRSPHAVKELCSSLLHKEAAALWQECHYQLKEGEYPIKDRIEAWTWILGVMELLKDRKWWNYETNRPYTPLDNNMTSDVHWKYIDSIKKEGGMGKPPVSRKRVVTTEEGQGNPGRQYSA